MFSLSLSRYCNSLYQFELSVATPSCEKPRDSLGGFTYSGFTYAALHPKIGTEPRIISRALARVFPSLTDELGRLSSLHCKKLEMRDCRHKRTWHCEFEHEYFHSKGLSPR